MATETVSTTADSSDRTFALRVEGDSMTSKVSGARSFPAGTILIVDPDRGARAGDFVLAKRALDGRTGVGQLFEAADGWHLKQLNPAYPDALLGIDLSAAVIGRVVEFQIRGQL